MPAAASSASPSEAQRVDEDTSLPPPGGGTAAEERDDAPSGSEAPVTEDGAEEGEAVGDQGARGSSPPPGEVAAEADEPEQ